MSAKNPAFDPKKDRTHLIYLDGLRGLSAFYVLLFHVIVNGKETLSRNDAPFYTLLRFGHEAVVVFIVLSGFLLALSVAESSQLSLPGGLPGFFRRRARRILPGYYPALFVLPIFYGAVEFLKMSTGDAYSWDWVHKFFLSKDTLVHVLLLQNLSTTWSFSPDFNPLLWSVATEWWIYFVFALILVPIWRRFGLWVAALVSVLLSLIPPVFYALNLPSLAGSPYLLGAFGMGMVSAGRFHRYKLGSEAFCGQRKYVTAIGISSVIVFALILIYLPMVRATSWTRWITDYLVAIACAAFIYVTATALLERNPKGSAVQVVKLLESRPALFLGRFSYSLYLTHLVAWAMFGMFLNLEPVRKVFPLSLEPLPMRLFLLIPMQVLFAYGFYLIFEKPFLRQRSKNVPVHKR